VIRGNYANKLSTLRGILFCRIGNVVLCFSGFFPFS